MGGTKNIKDHKKLANFIKGHGDAKGITWDMIYENCLNSGATCGMIEIMMESILDDGTGGTSPDNNREYGGTYVDGDEDIHISEPGPVTEPSAQEQANINIRTKSNEHSFHSHPSGTRGAAEIDTQLPASANAQTINFAKRGEFKQSPSPQDFLNAKYPGNWRILFLE